VTALKALISWVLCSLSISLCAASAHAAAPERAEDKPAAAEMTDSFGHGRQLGLRVGLVGGYNMIFRYDQSSLCAPYEPTKTIKDQKKVCGHTAPLALDLAASFAVLDFIEPYAFVRLGLKGETETSTKPLLVLGVGARIYTMSDSAFKIFIEPALAWELEKGSGAMTAPGYAPEYNRDLLFHLAAGPQLDFARYAGVFVDAGLTTGILRSIHSELELQLGLQARFP
jgi:hypothetical protein